MHLLSEFPIFKLTNIKYLNERRTFVKKKTRDKVWNFDSLNRSTNQSVFDFKNSCDSSKLTFYAIRATNPFLFVVIGDFNAKFNIWYNGD